VLKRSLTTIILLGLGLPSVFVGGFYFFVVIAFFLVLAAWEYTQIMRQIGHQLSAPLIVGGVFVLLASRVFLPASTSGVFLLFIFAIMAWHVWQHEKGRNPGGTDFSVSVAGLLYIGWLGGFLFELRNISEHGAWWFFLVLTTVWIADSAAYLFGSRWGKTPLTKRISPKKTWEGYWAGVVAGTAIGTAIFYAIAQANGLTFHLGYSLGLGLLITIVSPIGDLGKSLFKREAHIKNSSEIFPGHGGAFDRIDTWLWAGVLGYYYILTFLV
jgi:phosphatidate cytidylyltransferase